MIAPIGLAINAVATARIPIIKTLNNPLAATWIRLNTAFSVLILAAIADTIDIVTLAAFKKANNPTTTLPIEITQSNVPSSACVTFLANSVK